MSTIVLGKVRMTGKYIQHYMSLNYRSSLPAFRFLESCEAQYDINADQILEKVTLGEKDLSLADEGLSLYEIMSVRITTKEFFDQKYQMDFPASELGILWGKAYELKKLDCYGEYIRTAPTIGSAIALTLQLNDWLNYLGFELSIHRSDNRVRIFVPRKLHDCSDGMLIAENATIEQWRMLLETVGFPASERIDFSVTFPEPVDKELYAEFYPHRVLFDQKHLCLEFSESLLSLPNPNANETRHADLAVQMGKLMSDIKIKFSPKTFGDKFLYRLYELYVKQSGNISEGCMKRFVDWFNVSPRTVNRVLKKEQNETLKSIVSTGRVELASVYLTFTKNSVEEISRLTGYSNPANFYRAFMKKTGLSPTEYREKNSVFSSVTP